jgi:hypothetical protein
MAPGLNRAANGPQGALCGPSASQSPPSNHETPRIQPRETPALSRVFPRIRWPSQDMNQSGRSRFRLAFLCGFRGICGPYAAPNQWASRASVPLRLRSEHRDRRETAASTRRMLYSRAPSGRGEPASPPSICGEAFYAAHERLRLNREHGIGELMLAGPRSSRTSRNTRQSLAGSCACARLVSSSIIVGSLPWRGERREQKPTSDLKRPPTSSDSATVGLTGHGQGSQLVWRRPRPCAAERCVSATPASIGLDLVVARPRASQMDWVGRGLRVAPPQRALRTPIALGAR